MMYSELKDKNPKLENCFFAFSNKQLEEGLKKHNLKKSDVVSAAGGLIGTKEGINKLYNDYEKISEEIKEKCTPQDVYNYEFDNHECSYTGDDTEAIELVHDYFGKDAKFNRRF